MRRHVRALRHVAHVAEVTVIDHIPVDLLVDGIELSGRRFVDRIEERREGVAKAEAAPTAVTDIEDALELLEQRLFIYVVGILPRDGVTRGSFETAFALRKGCGWLGHDVPTQSGAG